MKQGKIYAVSLGPGDPGLITMKGLEVLKAADKVFYPGSLSESGKSSYSATILQHYSLEESKQEGFYLKMNGNPEAADHVYEEVCQRIVSLYREGLTIAIVTEGDATFYSTFIYLLLKFKELAIPVEIIPGVSSVHTASAFGKFPLAVQNEKIAVLPVMGDVSKLNEYLSSFDTLVLLKFRSVAQELLPHLMQMPFKFLYCERLGTGQQYITENLGEIGRRDIPYFSLLIISKHKLIHS